MEPLKTDAWHNDTEDPHFVILEEASEQIAGEYFLVVAHISTQVSLYIPVRLAPVVCKGLLNALS